MNRGKSQVKSRLGGYTLVETLIFLAVSSLLFFSAMLLIGGQQNKAQFVNAVRDLETRLTDISNDIATGYYSNNANFECTTPAGKPEFTSVAPGGKQQGTNKDCMLVGTVMKFTATSDSDKLNQFSMAGTRVYNDASGEHTVADLGTAQPQAIYVDSAGVAIDNAVTTSDLLYGATVSCIGSGSNCVPSADPPTALGFFASLVPTGGQGGNIGTDLFFYPNVKKSASDTATTQMISYGAGPTSFNYASPPANTKNPTNGITICLKSGGTDQYALVHLGGSSTTRLVVTSEIKSGSSCL